MRAAKLWLAVFGLGFAVLIGLLLITLLTPAPSGNLARIAQVSSHQFAQRQAPLAIPMATIRQSTVEDADILVIGDSFSAYFAWQSELVGAGYRVATTHWDQVGTLCQNFGPWLQASGFKGRLVLVQSIEYMLPKRLAAMQTCTAMQPEKLALVPPPVVSPSTPVPQPRLNTEARLSHGFTTWRHTRRVAKATGDTVFHTRGASVLVTAAPDGCTQFSHRLCNKNLFLLEDRTEPELQAADAEFMRRFMDQVESVALRWMVIPNKTSVYLDIQHAQDFAERARARGIGPDLFAVAQKGRHDIRDLYWPDDNHWSMQGQLYFGRQVLSYVRTTIGAPREHH